MGSTSENLILNDDVALPPAPLPRAVRSGYLTSWPRLTTAIVLAHPPNTMATAKGHLNRRRNTPQSTLRLKSSTPTMIFQPIIPPHPLTTLT